MPTPLLTKITDTVFRFNNQSFYGSEVGTYLIQLPELTLLFDLPTFSPELLAELMTFKKPFKAL